jgi:hypothetical protein
VPERRCQAVRQRCLCAAHPHRQFPPVPNRCGMVGARARYLDLIKHSDTFSEPRSRCPSRPRSESETRRHYSTYPVRAVDVLRRIILLLRNNRAVFGGRPRDHGGTSVSAVSRTPDKISCRKPLLSAKYPLYRFIKKFQCNPRNQYNHTEFKYRKKPPHRI